MSSLLTMLQPQCLFANLRIHPVTTTFWLLILHICCTLCVWNTLPQLTPNLFSLLQSPLRFLLKFYVLQKKLDLILNWLYLKSNPSSIFPYTHSVIFLFSISHNLKCHICIYLFLLAFCLSHQNLRFIVLD